MIIIQKRWKEGEISDLARKPKVWNLKVTVIPVVVGALGTIPKGLVHGLEDLEIRGKVETIQTTAYAQHRIRPGEWNTKSSLGFWDANRSPNLGQTARPSQQKEKKKENENLPNSEFIRLSRPQSIIKESEKEDKYLDFAREPKRKKKKNYGPQS